MDFNETLFNEILNEVIEEEKVEEQHRKEIIAKGCPCINKEEHIGTFTKIHFLQCPICGKQFNMDGTEISQ